MNIDNSDQRISTYDFYEKVVRQTVSFQIFLYSFYPHITLYL